MSAAAKRNGVERSKQANMQNAQKKNLFLNRYRTYYLIVLNGRIFITAGKAKPQPADKNGQAQLPERQDKKDDIEGKVLPFRQLNVRIIYHRSTTCGYENKAHSG
ncbi:MAG: hypothetical protein LBU22_01625 [Dysgonamonadaceae bacterium]|jgi:hypothetical protein|nr:hypothetical protein [Dysgonamonadaceae bacterium]